MKIKKLKKTVHQDGTVEMYNPNDGRRWTVKPGKSNEQPARCVKL